MQLPELLWMRHVSAKQGLTLDRYIIPGASTTTNAIDVTHETLFEDAEYDLLLTHFISLALDAAQITAPLYASIFIRDPKWSVDVGIHSASSPDITLKNFYISLNRPVLVSSGGVVAATARFDAAAITNSISVAGYGWLIPKIIG